MNRILPGQPFPDISFPLISGAAWSLAKRRPKTFTMLIVFRHAFCSFCRRQLTDIEDRHQELGDLGVEPVAVSCDTLERTQTLANETQIEKLSIGYGLPFSHAGPLGLFVSSRNKDIEPETFFEPGTFLIDSDCNLFMTATQNMAFGRPTMREMLEAISYAVEKNVPARGRLDPSTLS